MDITRTVSLRPRVTEPDEALRPTRAEIDLGAIAHNLSVVRRRAGAARVCAVVKADAYGHGVVRVAQKLASAGVDAFGVALAEEGIELRDAGIAPMVLVLNGVYGGAYADVIARGLTPVVFEIDDVRRFAEAARGTPFGIHLKVDTGMARLGVPLSRLEDFLRAISRIEPLRIEGLMTHLAAADDDDGYTNEQLARFADAQKILARYGHRPTTLHVANSAATWRHPRAHFDLVRTGVALFGYAPWGSTRDPDLAPAMRLRTEIIALRDLEPGESVGYSRGFVARKACRIASVPVGYGDGLMRALSNRGSMLIRGVRAPIVGNVSMDLTTLDVSAIPGVAIGDEALVLGVDGDQRITAEDVATAAGTIPYEVLTNVSRRVPRFFAE